MEIEEIDLISKKMFTSKDVWKLVSGVAVAVFVITLIYARFLAMEKTIEFLSESHAAEMQVLIDRVDTQNNRLVAADEKAEADIDALEEEIMLLKLDAHEPAPGQKRIHR